MLPVSNVANSQLGVANDQLGIGNWNWQHFHIGNILKILLFFLMPATRLFAAVTSAAPS
jgi:hypothetical protein